jgi:hypothetical protein
MALLTFLVACTVAHYLLARAEITRWLWSRFPPWFDRWASCAACSGTWIGAALSFYVTPPSVGGGHLIERILWGAAWGLYLTPLGTWALVATLRAIAVEVVEPPVDELPTENAP